MDNNNNDDNSKFKLKCSEHNKELTLICENEECDSCLICIKCVTTSHKYHSFTDLEEIDNDTIQTLIDDFKTNQLSEVKEKLKLNNYQLYTLRETFNLIEEQFKEDELNIIKTYLELRDLLSKVEIDCITKFEENKEENKLKYQNIKKELESDNHFLNLINNKYNNDLFDFENKLDHLEILHYRNIFKYTIKNDSFNDIPLDNKSILSSCECISKSIKSIVEKNPIYNFQMVCDIIKEPWDSLKSENDSQEHEEIYDDEL